MKTAESTQRPRKGRAYWLEQVKAWEASGGTQSDYCRKHQLSERLFSLWKNKFTKEQHSSEVSSTDFLPVITTPEKTTRVEYIGIILPNGIELQVPPSSLSASIADLAKDLVSLSC